MSGHIKISLLLILLSMLMVTPRVSSWNDASRMATIESLVERHTFIIDESEFVSTGDKVFINGHYYSDKPIIPAVVGAIIYAPLYYFGVRLDYGINLAYYLITIFTVKLFWVLGLLAFYLILHRMPVSEKERVWLTLALGFASLHFTWSSIFNNHSLAASFLVTGFYFFKRQKYHIHDTWNYIYAGTFFSLAGACDMPVFIFYAGFLLSLFFNKEYKKMLMMCIPAFFILMPALLFNYSVSGSIMPLQLNKSFFEYPGSPWNLASGMSGMTINTGWNLVNYSFNSLLGKNGFIIYNPLLFVAIPCLIYEIKNRRKFWKEGLVIGVASLILIAYYCITTRNFGGNSYSIRWFVPLLPLLFIFLYAFLENPTIKRTRIFWSLFFISFVISSVGLVDPWTDRDVSKSPFIANIYDLISHD